MDQAVARRSATQGEEIMFGRKFQNQLLVAIASLLMSSIAVGAAIAPAHVGAQTVEVLTYA